MRVTRIVLTLAASLVVTSAWTVAQQRRFVQPENTASEAQVPGDPVKGQAVFEGQSGCLHCHRVADEGSFMGPDLSVIATERTVAELQKSLLDPSPEVQPKNQLYHVVTSNGETVTGRILNQDEFSLQMLDSAGRLRAFQKSSLRESGFTTTPAMPSYRDKLTVEEQTNLIAFLASLRGPAIRMEIH